MVKENKTKKKAVPKTQRTSGDGFRLTKLHYLLAVVCMAAGIALYANTYGHGFVLDDSAAITDNLYVQEGIQGIPKLLTIDFWHFSAMRLGYYRPLPLITYAVEYQFFGRHPFIYHFNNVNLYGLTAFALFLYLSMLFAEKKYYFPLIVTLLFIAHPLHTEVVANIKSRDEILSLLLTFLMLVFLCLYRQKRKTVHLALSLIFCFLSLLSKETAMVGILLVPVTLYYRGEKVSAALRKSAVYLLPVFLFYVQKKLLCETIVPVIPNDLVNYPYAAPELRYSSAFMLFAFFLRILVVPYPLRYDYSYNQLPALMWNDLLPWVGLLLFAGLAVLGLRGIWKKSVAGYALAFFFITLIPAFGFVLLRGGIFAERFLYAPSLGLCLAVVILVEAATGTKLHAFIPFQKELIPKMLLPAAIFLLLFTAYSAETVTRNRAWSAGFTLYSTDIKTANNNVHNLLHYGSSWLRKANDEKDKKTKLNYLWKGIGSLRQAIQILPTFSDAFYWLGYAYEVKATSEPVPQNADTAIFYFNEAIKCSATMYMSYYHMANVYEWFGRYDVSSYFYNKAYAINPEFPPIKAKVMEMKQKHGLDVHINPLTGKP